MTEVIFIELLLVPDAWVGREGWAGDWMRESTDANAKRDSDGSISISIPCSTVVSQLAGDYRLGARGAGQVVSFGIGYCREQKSPPSTCQEQ